MKVVAIALLVLAGAWLYGCASGQSGRDSTSADGVVGTLDAELDQRGDQPGTTVDLTFDLGVDLGRDLAGPDLADEQAPDVADATGDDVPLEDGLGDDVPLEDGLGDDMLDDALGDDLQLADELGDEEPPSDSAADDAADSSSDVPDANTGCGSVTPECQPGEHEEQSVECGNCGSELQTRSCNATSCTWNDWIGNGCVGEGLCKPGDRKPGCDLDSAGNPTPCGEQLCNASCQWDSCMPVQGAACLSRKGTSYQCCTPSGGGSGWQFCSSSTCQWFPCEAHTCN